jgi:flagellar motor switch protein FliN/FliY
MYAPPQPKVVNSQPMAMPQLDLSETLGKEQAQNLDLIMGVPLQVTVEIGRTKRKVQDILSYSKGSLVVLDKLAGDQVDLFVNGKCIARGDVVVIEDNFGVRITEILQKPGVEDIIQK